MRFPSLTAIVSVFRVRPEADKIVAPETRPEIGPDIPERPRNPTRNAPKRAPKSKRRTRRVRDADGNLVARPKPKARKAKRAPRKAKPAAEPADPAPVKTDKTRPINLPALPTRKLWTGAEFYSFAIQARYAAQAACGERWDLVPGASVRMLIPSRCLSYRTNVRSYRMSGDRRFPAACFWIGGELPPGCVAQPEYAWEQAAAVVGRVDRGARRGRVLALPAPEPMDVDLAAD